MRSPHTVAHRGSLAYRMFVLAAETKDRWLRNQDHGDFSATVQKYYTGMSLSRYVFLVGVEFPLIVAMSLLTWLTFPATLVYFIARLTAAQEQIGTGDSLFFALIFVVVILLSAFLFFLGYVALVSWASTGPNAFTRVLRKHFLKLPIYHRGEDIEKFPGPVALFKKWILSTAKGVPAQITWDSGRRDRD